MRRIWGTRSVVLPLVAGVIALVLVALYRQQSLAGIKSLFYYASSSSKSFSRHSAPITDKLLLAKQKQLASLSVGSFTNASASSAYDYLPKYRSASELYAKWAPVNATLQCLRNRRLYLVGTSFQRSILWSLLRRLLGDAKDVPPQYRLIASVPALVRERDPVTGKCDAMVGGVKYDVQARVPWKTAVPSCLLVKNTACEHPGPAGILLDECGMPMSAKWTSSSDDSNIQVHYQFKTYISAPPVDHRIFATLKQSTNKWDLVWIESGEWGSWGTPHERERTTYQESLDFLRRAAKAHSGWIIISGNSGYTEQNKLFLLAAKAMATKYGNRVLVFDQKPIVQAADHARVPQGHGYYGAATDVMVRVVLAVMCDGGEE